MTAHPQAASDSDDVAVVARVRSGDARAFDALVIAYFPTMVGYGESLVESRDAAEDVAQNVLARLWRLRTSWHVTSTIRTYLLSAVRHEALNRHRAARADARRRATLERIAEIDATLVDIGADVVSDRADVAALLATLPAKRREALVLRYGLGLTFPEIGRIMGVTTKAVEQLVMRTLRTLRDRHP